MLTIIAVSIVASAPLGRGQSVDLIGERLNGIRRGSFRLGPFYVTPALTTSSGYDSNALSTPDASSDVTARFGPSVLLTTPLGSAGFVEIDQRIDYVYYWEQIDLRRWLDTTRVGLGFGGRRFLFEVEDAFFDGTGRPTSEFDFPVQQRTNALTASLTLALGWRHDLRVEAEQTHDRITEGLDDDVVRNRLNRDVGRYTLGFRRHMTSRTSAVAEGFYERIRFADTTRDAESTGGRFGLEFTPGGGDPLGTTPWGRSFVSGRFLLGFRSVTPLSDSLVDYTGLLGSVDVVFGFGSGHGVQLQYARDVVPSIFQDNWYFVENRWGASVRFQVTDRLSLTPGASFGKNDYPLPADGEELNDEHRLYRLSVSYRVAEHWSVGGNLDYLSRDSNVVLFGKERLQAGFTLSFQP